MIDSINTWLFDLDDTLYPSNNIVSQQIQQRMGTFIMQALNLPAKQAIQLQKQYFQDYGTTCYGLMQEHNINPSEYFDYVNNVDLTTIKTNPNLYKAIKPLSGKKYIVTNADKTHALKVIQRLGIDDLIDGIFDIAASHYIPKPHEGYFQQLITELSIDPQHTIFFDDLAKNCRQAKQFAMTTVLIDDTINHHKKLTDIDYVSHSVCDWLNQYYE